MLVINTPYKNFTIHLTLTEHITVVAGDSGSGKTLIYEALSTDSCGIELHKYSADSVLKYVTQDISESENCLFVFDRTELLCLDTMYKTIKQAINKDEKNYFLMFGRDVEGLEVTLGAIKQLEFVNNVLQFKE